jgi:hypothetical protein
MSFYLYIAFLGNDYCDVDVEYDVIDGDDSVGLPVDYEFSATVVDEDDNVIDITNDLTEEEIQEVYDAIKKDMNKTEWD